MIGQTFSHYRILSPLGEGGMGVVYVAEDTRLGRRVAIKFPLAGSDEKHYRARFLREARAVSALTHPNIAAVYDFGETDEGQPYIVMELVTGQSLSELLAQGLTLARAIEIIQDVAAALAEAHRRGVVHRDIKPTNVLINERDEVKVLDFGLAKQIDEEALAAAREGAASTAADLSVRTRSDVVIGTPLYLSPEQARGAAVDARSDLFSLGALLYECVAGRPPFGGANVIEIGSQVLYFDPPAPSRLNSRVPAELDRVALKALAKKPEERFQSAAEMISALEPVRARLAGIDTARTRRLTTQSPALRSSALMTLSDVIRRPRFSPLALAALLVAVLLGVWGYTYLSKPSKHKLSAKAAPFYQRGAEAMRDGTYHRASIAFSEAIRHDERYALAHARLAEAWFELDFRDRAQEELILTHKLIPNREALDPLDALYLDAITATVGRDYRAAIEAYAKIAELNPESPEVYVDLGRAYEKNNEMEKAVASYTEATRRDQNYATAFLRLGVLYGRQQNQAAAASAFERAERFYAADENQEGRAEVLYQRGLQFSNTGRLPEARRDLEQSLEIARASGNQYQQAQALLQLSAVSSGENNHTQAVADAEAAGTIAQAGDMPNLSARSLIALGTAYLRAGKYEESERHLNSALSYSRVNRLRRYEAQALFNLGSLRLQQKRTDEGLELVEQARQYYGQGGYRREAAQAALLIGRTRRQRGDHAGAIQTFEELLRQTEPTGDMLQLADTHRELGTARLFHGDYPDALRHFDESHAIYKLLNNRSSTAYALVKRADALWRLGRHDEARDSLTQAEELAGRAEGGDKNLHAYINIVEAYLALSQRRFPEAAARSKRVLEVSAQLRDMIVEAKRTSGLAALHAGTRAQGLALCEEGAQKAEELGDPLLIALAQLSLAEARAEAGKGAEALASVRRAIDFFAQAGVVEMEWQACAVAARASRRAGDEESAHAHSARGVELLSRLRASWGEEAANVYLARPDLERLRREIGDQTVAAAR